MNDDVKAAADRIREWTDFLSDLLPTGKPQLAEVRVADLRLLLAAVDQADQPIPHVPTKAGLKYLAIRRQQHPKEPHQ